MVFWTHKPDVSEAMKDIVLRLTEKVHGIEQDIKNIKDSIEKLEIKALESRKIYHKKLKNLLGDEEKQESETNIKPSVFLSPNGAPI